MANSGNMAIGKNLVATYPILYLSRQYNPGDILPANDESMVKAWLEAKTAVWMEEKTETAKAVPVTAEGGLPGEAVSSESTENLVGKVPKTASRKKKA